MTDNKVMHKRLLVTRWRDEAVPGDLPGERLAKRSISSWM